MGWQFTSSSVTTPWLTGLYGVRVSHGFYLNFQKCGYMEIAQMLWLFIEIWLLLRNFSFLSSSIYYAQLKGLCHKMGQMGSSCVSLSNIANFITTLMNLDSSLVCLEEDPKFKFSLIHLPSPQKKLNRTFYWSQIWAGYFRKSPSFQVNIAKKWQ